jgi:multiple sugar transport system ATP-binding protein
MCSGICRALSNGQKQRTALARALVGEPKVLLLDDPLRNVDAKLRYEMRLELPRLLRRAGAATIHVTQDYREAMALGDRVAVLQEGAIAQLGAPEQIYDQPGTLAVARLFGDPPVNLIPCRPVPEAGGLAVHLDGLHVVVDAATYAAGKACMLGLRPETLRLERAPRTGFAAAEIVATTPLHERQVLLLRTAGGSELVASLVGVPPPPGTRVWVGAEAARALLFEAAGGRRIPPARAAKEQAA